MGDIILNYKVLLFIITFFSLYTLTNYYIGTRVYKELTIKVPINNKWFWILFWMIAFAYMVSMLLSNYISGRVITIFNLIGVYWIGIFFYLILIFPFIDLIKFINRRFELIPKTLITQYHLSLILSLMIAVFIAFVLIYGTWSGSHSYVKKYNINIEKNTKKIKDLNIVMVSDIHLGTLIDGKRLKRMVDEINVLNPDIVILAGDIVDTEIKPFIADKMAFEFSNIKTQYGVFAALGNHDLMRGHEETIAKELKTAGVSVLRDEWIKIKDEIYIVGRDDISINRIRQKRKSLEEILSRTDKTQPILLIDHTPSSLPEGVKNKVDLQLSGHTHKGQFFPNNLITKSIFEVDHGYLRKNNLHVLVSSGYGTWGPPIRIGSRSEIVNINLRFEK